ncbi:MAG: hypothetical protein ABIM89_06345 [Mycobacteriales bacterium]
MTVPRAVGGLPLVIREGTPDYATTMIAIREGNFGSRPSMSAEYVRFEPPKGIVTLVAGRAPINTTVGDVSLTVPEEWQRYGAITCAHLHFGGLRSRAMVCWYSSAEFGASATSGLGFPDLSELAAALEAVVPELRDGARVG